MKLKKIKRSVWSHIDSSGGPDACWPWRGETDDHGHPILRVGSGAQAVEPLVYAWEHAGDEGRSVRHACGRPDCLNPDHLSPASHADVIRERLGDDLPPPSSGVTALRLVLAHRTAHRERKAYDDPH